MQCARYFVGLYACLIALGTCGSLLAAQQKPEKPSVVNAHDFDSINEAIQFANEQEIRRIYVPAGDYVVTETIDLTGHYGDTGAITVEGDGPTSRIVGRTGKHPVIDLTGSGHCQINNLAIVGEDANVGLLMARVPGRSAGWHYFYGLRFYGSFRKAAVYSLASEVNRFVSCEIWNYWKGKEGGDGLVFAPSNIYDVQSPKYKEKTVGGCNTELTVSGITISTVGPESVGVRIVGYASDVRFYGSYIHSDSFSAIYLDGTKGPVDSVTFKDVRIEAEDGRHCLFARGHVRNLSLENGCWYSNFEPIKQVDAPCWTDKEFCTDDQGAAFNWKVENLFLFLHDGIAYEVGPLHARPDPEATEYPLTDDGYVFMHFDRLLYSRIRCVSVEATRIRPGPDGKPVSEAPWRGNDLPVTHIVVEKKALGNRFAVMDRSHVALRGQVKDNLVDALRQEE